MKTATRHTALRAWAVVGLFGGLSALAGAQEGPESTERALQDLLEDHPEARVEFSRGESPRARSVFGTPMTRAERPEDAAAQFLARYGAAFVDGRAEFELVESFGRLKGGRVLHYRQTIGGVPVDGSAVRVFVHEDGESLPAVAYASGHFARPPALGLPEPVVTAGEALVIAQMHPAGQLLDEWTEPELVVTTTSGVLSRGVARLAWRVNGWALSSAWGFWVDAQTGEVFRDLDLIARYQQTPTPPVTVSGTVSGGATQGTEPDKPVGHRCGANLPVLRAMPELVVEITDATGTTVLDSTTTSATGTYQFFGTSYPTDAQIRFTWDAQSRWLFEGIILPGGACDFVEPAQAIKSLGTTFPVQHDHVFNPVPFDPLVTSLVNIHFGLIKTRDFLLDRLPTAQYPELFAQIPVLANHCVDVCGAFYRPEGPALTYGRQQAPGCDFNRAYSTIITHEYTHSIVDKMLDIPPDPPHDAFHEGISDALAMFVHDVDIYAEDWKPNCDALRMPLTATPSMFFDCSYILAAIHDRGMLLSALWLDMAADPTAGGLGATVARQLFVDWMLLTAGGVVDGPTGCTTQEMPAGPPTLIEVLIADDDDGALNNGTPNDAEICAIFAARGIASGSSPCGLPFTGGTCAVDLDHSGAVDVYDYLMCMGWLHAGDGLADWDRNGTVTIMDAIEFANDFEEGC